MSLVEVKLNALSVSNLT